MIGPETATTGHSQMSGSAKQRPAYEEVASRLIDMIVTGKLVPGDRLSEAELCERFEVGRSTVREALRILASQHLVTTRAGIKGGSVVARLDHDNVREMLTSSVAMLTQSNATTMMELLEIRQILEVPAASLAATRRTGEQLERLRLSIPKTSRGVSQGAILTLNRAFHEIIIEASANRMLHLLAVPLLLGIEDRFHQKTSGPAFWQKVISDHTAIFQAIQSGDSEEAYRTMAVHLGALVTTYRSMDGARIPC
jgi:GntR family transcriptional regulator, transcriptional repressor for pyruvate dehydrogenase complex